MTVVVVNTGSKTIAPVTCSQMEKCTISWKPTLLQCRQAIKYIPGISEVCKKYVRNDIAVEI